MLLVVFFVDIVEGKDKPKDIGKMEFETDYGATVGKTMRTTKRLFGTGKDVVMDSGFCVLKEIEGMLAHGLYGKAVMKKK